MNCVKCSGVKYHVGRLCCPCRLVEPTLGTMTSSFCNIYYSSRVSCYEIQCFSDLILSSKVILLLELEPAPTPMVFVIRLIVE